MTADPIYAMSPGIERLLEIMRRLRDPQNGCPWDIEQDFHSIAPYTIEEAYEVADAIAREDWAELKSELGDLLLQSVYHAQMASEADLFDFEAIAAAIGDKMIARHPHVFGSESRDKTAEQQTLDWERLKARERAQKAETGALDGVALGLPALMRAEKLQKRAARVGFDFGSAAEAMDKHREEIQEFTQAQATDDLDHLGEEYGDMLFSLVNVGRKLGLDAETALRRANDKFTRRFAHIERRLAETGRTVQDATLEEMDAYWNEIRHREKSRGEEL